jgi:hypothetical protein
MQYYYAITDSDIIDLGMHSSPSKADYLAVDTYNIHCARFGYVVVSHKQLEAIKNKLETRGVGIY